VGKMHRDPFPPCPEKKKNEKKEKKKKKGQADVLFRVSEE